MAIIHRKHFPSNRSVLQGILPIVLIYLAFFALLFGVTSLRRPNSIVFITPFLVVGFYYLFALFKSRILFENGSLHLRVINDERPNGSERIAIPQENVIQIVDNGQKSRNHQRTATRDKFQFTLEFTRDGNTEKTYLLMFKERDARELAQSLNKPFVV